MYIEYTDDFGQVQRLTRVKKLSFSPEVDLTLSSLPVDEFSADVVTDVVLRNNEIVELKDDTGALWARFYVQRWYRIDAGVMRVEAMSPMGFLDRRTLGAERVLATAGAVIEYIMTGLPKSGTAAVVDYTLPVEFQGVQLDGFCPEQTARERLAWVCLAIGACVRQSFCRGLVFEALPRLWVIGAGEGKLIPLEKTYWKPQIQVREPVYSVELQGIHSLSTEETYENMQSGVDESGTKWYWLKSSRTFRNLESVTNGKEVKYEGITLIDASSAKQFQNVALAHMLEYEIQADVIDDCGEFQPGDRVLVYVDERTCYLGLIKSCAFSFGNQAKARLNILAAEEAISMKQLEIIFTAEDGTPLGREALYLPDGEGYDIESPHMEGYTANPARVQGYLGDDTTVTVQYTKIALHHIELIREPNKKEVVNGKPIDFTGLVVKGYDEKGLPWTDCGQYRNGILPMTILVPSATRGDLEDVHEPIWLSTPKGGLMVDGVEFIGPVGSVVFRSAYRRRLNIHGTGWADVIDWGAGTELGYGTYYDYIEEGGERIPNNRPVYETFYHSVEGADYTATGVRLPDGTTIWASKDNARCAHVVVFQDDIKAEYGVSVGVSAGVINNTYTYQGKTAYWNAFNPSWHNERMDVEPTDIFFKNPTLEGKSGQAFYERLAWLVLYLGLADPYSGMQTIEIGVSGHEDVTPVKFEIMVVALEEDEDE